MKRTRIRIMIVLILSSIVLPTLAAAEAKGDIESDLRLQPYVYAGPTSFISYGGSAFEFGGGMDWLVYKGLGLGFDASILGDAYSAVASGSFNVSYHFIPRSPGLVPFVVVGIGGAGAPEYGDHVVGLRLGVTF